MTTDQPQQPADGHPPMVLVAYVPGMLKPETRAWVDRTPAAYLWPMPPGDREAYWRVLNLQWRRARRPLVVVEQDMVPPPGEVSGLMAEPSTAPDMLAGFDACPEPWCFHSYRVFMGDIVTHHGLAGLGCVRFRRELLTATAPCFARLPRDWQNLDERINEMLTERGYVPCMHSPEATHLHEYNVDAIDTTVTIRDGRLTITERGIGTA